jgi:hypothetical protein
MGRSGCGLLTDNFDAPNPDDSFRTFAEQVLEDIVVGGYGAIEVQLRPGWEGDGELRSPGRTGASAAPHDCCRWCCGRWMGLRFG